MAETKVIDKPMSAEEMLDELFNIKPSIDLSPDNAHFFPSEGGLISLTVSQPGEAPETYERVIVLRSFPLTNPDSFLSVRLPDDKEKGKGREVGIIKSIHDFDEETQALLLSELNMRYYTPAVTKIHGIKEKLGYYYWDVETDSGPTTFVLNSPFSNIRTLDDGSVIIDDMEGNCFVVPDPEKLDHASYKRIEVYL